MIKKRISYIITDLDVVLYSQDVIYGTKNSDRVISMKKYNDN